VSAAALASSRWNANEKRVLGVTSAAHFLAHLYELAFPAIALFMMQERGWDLAHVLRLSFLMYLLFGLGALPMGLLTDHWRARGMLVVCMAGGGVGALAVAVSRTETQLIAALALVGLAGSIYHPAGMALLSKSLRARGRALGWNGIFGNLGSATAPFVAGFLAYQFGWRTAYAVLGGFGVACGLASFFVRLDEAAAAPVAAAAAARRATTSLRTALVLLCIAMALAGFAYRGVSILLPAVFREHTTFLAALLERIRFDSLAGLRNLAGATLASITYAAGMLGQYAAGHVADRYDLRKAYLVFHAASLPFLFLMGVAHEGALLAAACFYVFFALGMQPIENSLVAQLTPPRWRSTSYGVKFILTFGAGSTAVHAVTALQAGGGFAAAFNLLGLLVAGLCIAVLLLLARSRGTAVHNTPATVTPLA
jgi:MFS family permease